MTNNDILLKDNIKKPLKPHRVVYPHEFPTQSDILKEMEQIKKMESLGIEVDVFDGSDEAEEYEEDIDKLKASILIKQGKELPKDLEERLIQKKKRADSKKHKGV